MKILFRVASTVAIVTILTLLSGCGGGNNSSGLLAGGNEQTLTFGNLTTRIAGTVQPPVSTGEAGVVVTGVAGGTINSLLLRDTAANLNETRIAFISDRDGNREIYSMRPDGSDILRLTNEGAAEENPAWSPDGSKIAFKSERTGGGDIYVMNADGSGLVNLTSGSNAEEFGPSWSPDGTKIAFCSDRTGNRDIYTMNADGTNVVNVTHDTGRDQGPAWSPDGRRLAFMSTRDGGSGIYTVYPDGSGVQRLTNSLDFQPAWSPDGSRIAFTTDRHGQDDIYVMYADGSGQTRLTATNSINESTPTWSPDGSKIAFLYETSGFFDIFTMDQDGSNLVRLTNNTVADYQPNWSPFPRRKTLIGSGGLLGTTAAGFLFGQKGSLVQSIVAFDAVPQTSARVTVQTPAGSGLPNVLLAVNADSLTSLSFVNGTTIAAKIIGTGGDTLTATGAIVSFDAVNGLVASVLPYTASRAVGSGTPSITTENESHVMKGKFLGAWDGVGKNHAPHGASEVRLDPRTGKILGVK